MYRYESTIEDQMIVLYDSLDEKNKRRYAAIEAIKLGRGGINYISNLFGCDPKTIRKGTSDLSNEESMQYPGIRLPGAGPKEKIDTIDNIDSVFLDIIASNTAGDPMDENIKWTYLTYNEISDFMAKKGRGFKSEVHYLIR